MHIIIIGGGISGLSTYLHLRKHLPNPDVHKISILESHHPESKLPSPSTTTNDQEQPSLSLNTLSESTAIVGGGLGIGANGMRVLRLLDPDLHKAVVEQGFKAKNFVFKGANRWTLGENSTCSKGVDGEWEEEECCIASSRHGLWHTMRDFVEAKYGEGVVRYRKVINVQRDGGSGMVRVTSVSKDGNEESVEADLVIGADGVKSVVRKALFGDDEKYQPTYTGQSGVGGFLSTPIPSYITTNSAMVFTFSGSGFFGYSSGAPASSQSLMWWSTYETSSSQPNTQAIDVEAIKAALQKRHKNWHDPIIQETIAKAEVQSIYPTWALPSLPHWGERGIVLLGDAAHAMDPTTGQGVSQALEDSQTFALLLARLMKDDDGEESNRDDTRGKVDEAIKLFYEVRAPRVDKVVERGKKMAGTKGEVGVVKEYFMYVFLWILNHVPAIGRALFGDVNNELYGWSAEKEIDRVMAISK